MKIDGIEVVDSKVDMWLGVSDDHVAQSKQINGRANGEACAGWCSAMATKGVHGAAINLAVCYILKGTAKNKKWHRFWTSPSLRTEIISYDRSGVFHPGDYPLHAVPKSARAQRGKAHSLGAPKHGRPGFHRRKRNPILTGVRAHALCGLRTNGHNTIHKAINKRK
jgi:hypothetical protein